MGDTRFYFPSLQGLAQASEQTSSLSFFKKLLFAFIFCGVYSSGGKLLFLQFLLGCFFFLLCSLLFRFRNHLFFFSKDLLMWQGELVYGLIRPGALEVLC